MKTRGHKLKSKKKGKRYSKYPKGSVGYNLGYWGTDFKLKKPIKHKPKNVNEHL